MSKSFAAKLNKKALKVLKKRRASIKGLGRNLKVEEILEVLGEASERGTLEFQFSFEEYDSDKDSLTSGESRANVLDELKETLEKSSNGFKVSFPGDFMMKISWRNP